MGTNYYLTTNVCPHCGRGDEPRHIGKSSAGWCFSLHVYPDENIDSLEDWIAIWDSGKIKDEYGREISKQDMLSTITERGRDTNWKEKPYGYSSWNEFHQMNHSVAGPSGLLRHRINGYHCIGHGEGTYDYLVSDFS